MAQHLRDLSKPEAAAAFPVQTPGGGDPNRSVVMTVLRHELRQLKGSFRFKASAFLLVSLMTLAAMSSAGRYRSEIREQSRAADGYARQLAAATVDQAAEMLHPAMRPPWRLALAVDGGQAGTPNIYSLALSALVTPRLWRLHSGNYRLPDAEPLDWMFVIRVVLPLCAVLLGYSAVCGERRAGTLQLLLSYPVSSRKVFLGKFLALWSCLATPFTAGAFLSLLIAAGLGIPFQAQDLTKALAVALLGLWAAAFFVLVTLLVSSLAGDSSTSLSILAWLWVTAVIVVPAVSGLLAHPLRPIPSEEESGREMRLIDQRIAHEYAGREGHWRPPEWASADGFAWEWASAEAENRRSAQQEEVRRRILRRKLGQARLARALASLSPAYLIEDLAERLTGAGLWRDQSFLEQAWVFRSVLASRLRSLDARDPDSPHILFFSGYLSQRPLAPDAIGRFAFRERAVRQGLAGARAVLALFAVETLTLAAAALYSFSRCEVNEP